MENVINEFEQLLQSFESGLPELISGSTFPGMQKRLEQAVEIIADYDTFSKNSINGFLMKELDLKKRELLKLELLPIAKSYIQKFYSTNYPFMPPIQFLE